jgi:hypothetical protein
MSDLIGMMNDKARAAASEPQNWTGEIYGEPDTTAKTVSVVVPGRHASKPYLDAPYTPHPGPAHPSDGDRCLVGFDENDEPWVVAWRP